jgi:hypothetical protein
MLKCLVWDLDGTIWDGVLLEGDAAPARPGIVDAIVGPDRRGVLQAVASRNDPELARGRLADLELTDCFVSSRILTRGFQRRAGEADAPPFVHDLETGASYPSWLRVHARGLT